MKNTALIILFSVLPLLQACSDVKPEVSLLRSRITDPETTPEVAGTLNFVQTDQTSKAVASVSSGGYKMSAVVSKEDTTKEMVSAGGYTLIMNHEIE